LINNNNRQNGRRRGRGGGGGPRPQGNPGRPDGGGNRIDNRARGNAQQLHEKYKNLARDSQMAGDRVTTEYYLQFADHYFRVRSESRARFEEQRPQRRDDADDYDGEDGGDDFQAQDSQPQQRHYRERDRNQDGERQNNNYRRDHERPDRQLGVEQPEPMSPDRAPVAADEQSNEERRPARRGRRPREDAQPQPEALEADRLPPAIAIDSASEEAPAPKRRGRRPKAEAINDAVELPPAA
jgi:hypothetical protein